MKGQFGWRLACAHSILEVIAPAGMQRSWTGWVFGSVFRKEVSMCYRIHDLDRLREKDEKAAQQPHTPTTISLRLNERWKSLMAWLHPSSETARPVKVAPLEQAAPTEAAAKPVARPIDQACTSTARERETETV